jgi:hypothetical protein
MPATKQEDTTDVSKVKSEEPKKEVMGIERDDDHTRLSFTQDGNLMIVTIPIGKMSPALVHGFIYEMHDIVKQWFTERNKLRTQLRDSTSQFSFKQAVSKLFRK